MQKRKPVQGSRFKAQGKSAVAFSLQPRALSKTADLLFEIGAEELPAAYLSGLTEQFRTEATNLFQTQHLPFNTIESFGTPRRLVLIVRGLADVQRKPGAEVRGPSKQAAYGADGKPTPALQGFLRSQSGTIAQTKIVSSEKGEYIYLMKPPTQTPTAKLLPTLLPQLITRLRAPKTMRWDASGVRFARPIRWLAVLYGSTPIRCTYGTLASAPKTWIGGPLKPRGVAVRSINAYQTAIRQAGIILDQTARRRTIEQAVAKIAQQSKGMTAPEMVSHGLLDEVMYLVERPVPLAGTFDRTYLALPREVLLASMAKYQRVFAVESKGTLLPQFVAILDGAPKKPSDVRQTIERILNARLADSFLFWSNDRKRSLGDMADELSGVTFHERLGSMADKTKRLRQLSVALRDAWRLSADEFGQLERACELAKADLVSMMVKEFPTLQGVVGKYYALESGQPRAVAEALEEHYLPIGEKLPTTVIGSALAILDKYDTLAGYFAIGIMPTGDQDPFGLRRAAQGIVEIAWQVRRPLPLSNLFEEWRKHAGSIKAGPQTSERVRQYLLERLYAFSWPHPAPATDCIDAVLKSPCDDLVDAMDRIVSLRRLEGDATLLKAAKVIERTRNILKGAPPRDRQVDPARLQEPLERTLWDLYSSKKDEVERLAQQKSYVEATRLFGDVFYQPLHDFFDRVMVNVPDEAIQQNRLALMQAINTLYTGRVADLSELTVLQHQESHP